MTSTDTRTISEIRAREAAPIGKLRIDKIGGRPIGYNQKSKRRWKAKGKYRPFMLLFDNPALPRRPFHIQRKGCA